MSRSLDPDRGNFWVMKLPATGTVGILAAAER
jgi:hypothetical protein